MEGIKGEGEPCAARRLGHAANPMGEGVRDGVQVPRGRSRGGNCIDDGGEAGRGRDKGTDDKDEVGRWGGEGSDNEGER